MLQGEVEDGILDIARLIEKHDQNEIAFVAVILFKDWLEGWYSIPPRRSYAIHGVHDKWHSVHRCLRVQCFRMMIVILPNTMWNTLRRLCNHTTTKSTSAQRLSLWRREPSRMANLRRGLLKGGVMAFRYKPMHVQQHGWKGWRGLLYTRTRKDNGSIGSIQPSLHQKNGRLARVTRTSSAAQR